LENFNKPNEIKESPYKWGCILSTGKVNNKSACYAHNSLNLTPRALSCVFANGIRNVKQGIDIFDD